jgi:hypothetical protein
MDKFDPNLYLSMWTSKNLTNFWMTKHRVHEVQHLYIGMDKVMLQLMMEKKNHEKKYTLYTFNKPNNNAKIS